MNSMCGARCSLGFLLCPALMHTTGTGIVSMHEVLD